MQWSLRTLFPYLALTFILLASVWAVSFPPSERADFAFNNATEVESVDPARVTGAPEGRIIRMLLEGLFGPDPETLEPRPAMAVSADPKRILSKDGRTYTFTIRREAQWTDGSPVTAHDFRWSWRRFLHPEMGSQYRFLLTDYVEGAAKYAAPTMLEPGDRVAVELTDRPMPLQVFPSGTILNGTLVDVDKTPEPPDDIPDADQKKEDWRESWIFVVNINGTERKFRKSAPDTANGVEHCMHVLFDFEQVAIKAPADDKLEVRLKTPTPYFLYLMQFYPTFPVQQKCVEQYGFPDWTKPHNIVTNGPFVIQSRQIRDRIRLRKNDAYWNAANVKLQTVDAFAVGSATTSLNMYLDGQLDWSPSPPPYLIPDLKDRVDFNVRATLTIYFYRINTTKAPFNAEVVERVVDGKTVTVDRGKLVRQALNRAIDKALICTQLLRAGQQPARSFVPPGLPGYEAAECGAYDVTAARRLMTEAGFEGGQGCPTIEILHNADKSHRQLAEVIGDQWEKNLGVKVSIRSLEWGSFLSSTQSLDYHVARAGWIGDYPDPNTFLDLFITDGPQNETGWGNPDYDKLIEEAKFEQDAGHRLELLRQAEAILMDELPIIPIYAYVNTHLVKPYVKGFYPNSQDMHPIADISIDKVQRDAFLRAKRGRREVAQ